MTSEPKRRKVLLVDASAFASASAIEALRGAGIAVEAAVGPELALTKLDAFDPDALVTELDLGAKDGGWLLAQLQAKRGRGRPRRVVLTRPDAVRRSLDGLGIDAIVLKPQQNDALIGAALPQAHPDPAHHEDLLRELLGLSIFGGELPVTMADAAKRMARAFRVAECFIVVATGDTPLYATAGEPDVETLDLLHNRCAVATLAGASLYGPEGDPYRAYLAAPLGGQEGQRIGSVLLCDVGLRRFSPTVIQCLRSVAERLGNELAWRAIHERISAAHDRLRVLSRVDPLLGVWNRTALDQELPTHVASAVRRKEPLTVAILDVAALRRINDRHGHAAGDAALRHLAATLRRELRAQDMVARWAGDALAVVLPGTPVPQAEHVIERLQRDIAQTPLRHEDVVIPITVVAGLAELIGEDDTGEAAIGRALAVQAQARRESRPLGIADEKTQPVVLPESSGLEAGATLAGSYRVLHEISRGAFGVVYRAEDMGLGRPVAIKTLRPDLARDTALVDRFRAEAATLAAVQQENLVQVHAFGRDGEDVYFVMEIVEGESLEDRVHTAKLAQTDIPMTDVIRVIGEVAAALEAVHGAGILHRDVKPGNVLLDRVRKRAVLVDVGIAVRRGRGKDPAGTPGFTAPEAFTGAPESSATDVYGLAALAYMMLTLEPPFGEGAAMTILRRQTKEPPRRPSEIAPKVPPAVDAILLRALDPDPVKRPQSITEFSEEFFTGLQAPRKSAPAADDTDFSSTRLMWGRDLRPPAPASRPPTQRSHTFRTGETPELDSPHTRGVLFRSVYRVLGARRGAAWMSEVSRRDESLARALQPQGAPLSWHPTGAFIFMLRAFEGEDPNKFARELGRVATRFTFNLFYGADPSSQHPTRVLNVADLLWHCYHSWGVPRVDSRPEEATFTLTESLGEPLVCAATSGILEQIVSITGGHAPRVEHPKCGSECVFTIRWKP